MKRRIISLLMALALVFALLPAGALADTAGSGDTGSADIEKIVSAVEELINGGGSSADLGSILEGLDYNQLAQLVSSLIGDKVDIGSVVDELDVNELAGVIKGLVDGNQDISSVIDNLDTDQLVDLVGGLAGDNEAIGAVLEQLDAEQLAGVIKGLVDGDQDISSVIDNLDTDQLVALIGGLAGDNEALADILGQLDAEQLAGVIKGLVDGDQDISSVIDSLDTDQLVALISGLAGDNETIGAILEQLDAEQLAAVIKGLVDGDQDISSIIDSLDTDQLVALIGSLLGDNEALGAILEQLDAEQLAALIKALIAGDQDISSIIAQLDPYQILQLISGLFGSELDVEGPNNVTVTETEDAVFKVKVNLSLLDQLNGITYSYMWLEPDELKNLNDVNFENIDILSLIVRISGKSLGNGDTFTVQNTTMRDNGRKFVCVIYNVSEKVFYVTDEATLTVTPFSDCTHSMLKNVRGLEPTCTEAGHVAYYECSTCGKLFLDKECHTQTNSKDIVIPAKGHTPVESKAAVEPTCTEAGSTAETACSVCGEVLVSAKSVPAKGHRFDGIQCTVCGEYVPFPFKDVPEDYWCRSEVEYVWKHGIMKGITGDTFAPTAYMTRAMFVTVLYRMEGCPSVEGLSEPFVDVDRTYWAYDAIVWAYNAGVTTGVTATTFEPVRNISRAQLVTMMYRYENSPAVSGALTFVDSSDIAAPYRTAVLWAANNGIVNGYDDGTFRPNRPASRGHMAAILARYCQM